ncbi:MAG: Spy/CpxP family protein refolding chaperone [Gemmatimonadota bacterium]|nr:Spy/CpxP family protein refolding chaperone [Gemmatimonadota bacterium]
MRSLLRFTPLIIVLALSPALSAQQAGSPRRPMGPMPGMEPGGGGGPRVGPGGEGGGPVGNAPGFLLGHTGELRLTDAQVVKLAAIARRADDRHRAMRASMDSMASAGMRMGRDSASREAMARRFSQMQPGMEKMRDAGRADLRDAIALLTPDQQAQAWEMVASAARGRGRVNMGMARMRMRGGVPRDDMQSPDDGAARMRRRPDGAGGQPPGPPRPPEQQ